MKKTFRVDCFVLRLPWPFRWHRKHSVIERVEFDCGKAYEFEVCCCCNSSEAHNIVGLLRGQWSSSKGL